MSASPVTLYCYLHNNGKILLRLERIHTVRIFSSSFPWALPIQESSVNGTKKKKKIHILCLNVVPSLCSQLIKYLLKDLV